MASPQFLRVPLLLLLLILSEGRPLAVGNGVEERRRESVVGEELVPVNVHVDGYPDPMDIAGMDYTPAGKKKPIHN
ncbi:hypothetical protein AMTRI_Chr13g121910 [Amborella trichopoda]|uniref:Neprosin activation peptide domain-containing protein n=1 Tax=Amborella trichopoda TaxID=13333 RepID=U5DBZ4_AMBTC|nr:hypothetical protein AMTR_s00046p00058180 [Amborella trichopoda]